MNRLYLVKVGETDKENGKLQIIDLSTRKMIKEIEVGLNPVDLYFNDKNIYISNFDSNTLSRIDKNTFDVESIEINKAPFKIVGMDSTIFVINHESGTLQRLGENKKSWKIPVDGSPDNLFANNKKLVITVHNAQELNIIEFDTTTEKFTIVHNFKYPYGEVDLGTNNNSFYLSGQFGDGIYELNQIKADSLGRIWITDFLAGRLFIIN
jgi:DNA-binding beta-propeller fold protein YncE